MSQNYVFSCDLGMRPKKKNPACGVIIFHTTLPVSLLKSEVKNKTKQNKQTLNIVHYTKNKLLNESDQVFSAHTLFYFFIFIFFQNSVYVFLKLDAA